MSLVHQVNPFPFMPMSLVHQVNPFPFMPMSLVHQVNPFLPAYVPGTPSQPLPSCQCHWCTKSTPSCLCHWYTESTPSFLPMSLVHQVTPPSCLCHWYTKSPPPSWLHTTHPQTHTPGYNWYLNQSGTSWLHPYLGSRLTWVVEVLLHT